METPDPPSDSPGASKNVFLTPHDIPRILRVGKKKTYGTHTFREISVQTQKKDLFFSLFHDLPSLLGGPPNDRDYSILTRNFVFF